MKEIKINMSDTGYGANVLGIQHGYEMIKSLNPSLASKLSYVDHKIYPESMKLTNCKFYNTIYEACLKIYKNNLEDLKNNKMVVTLGGDHSLALGSVKASVEYAGEDIGLIWIDAHADINTFEISESGNIHGMPVSGLVGINEEKYNNLGNDIRVKPENIVYFATRAVDYEEKILIHKHNIKEISDAKIKASSFESSLADLITYLKGKVNKVHISLDLDSINPNDIKGVSTPVDGGLKLNEPIELIKKVNDTFEIVSIDIVEYNPLRDIDENTLKYIDGLVQDLEKITF